MISVQVQIDRASTRVLACFCRSRYIYASALPPRHVESQAWKSHFIALSRVLNTSIRSAPPMISRKVMNLRDSPNVSGLGAKKARRDRREKIWGLQISGRNMFSSRVPVTRLSSKSWKKSRLKSGSLVSWR
jgi:hypothetical protein